MNHVCAELVSSPQEKNQEEGLVTPCDLSEAGEHSFFTSDDSAPPLGEDPVGLLADLPPGQAGLWSALLEDLSTTITGALLETVISRILSPHDKNQIEWAQFDEASTQKQKLLILHESLGLSPGKVSQDLAQGIQDGLALLTFTNKQHSVAAMRIGIERVLAPDSALSRILGGSRTASWLRDLRGLLRTIEMYFYLDSLPKNYTSSASEFLQGMFRDDLPEWVLTLVKQAESVIEGLTSDKLNVSGAQALLPVDEVQSAGQSQVVLQESAPEPAGLPEILQQAIDDFKQAEGPLARLSVFLNMVSDDALRDKLLPLMHKIQPEWAIMLETFSLFKQNIVSFSQGGTLSALFQDIQTLTDPKFKTKLQETMKDSLSGPVVDNLLTNVHKSYLTPDSPAIAAINMAVRLTNPKLGWNEVILQTLGDISIWKMGQTLLTQAIKYTRFAPGWLEDIRRAIAALPETELGKNYHSSGWGDLPLLILATLKNDFEQEEKQLIPLLSRVAGPAGPPILLAVNILQPLLLSRKNGITTTQILARIVAGSRSYSEDVAPFIHDSLLAWIPGNISDHWDEVVWLAEKLLHLSLLWRMKQARTLDEITGLRYELNDVMIYLPDERIRSMADALEWLLLVRDLWETLEDVPAPLAAEGVTQWSLRLLALLGQSKKPGTAALRQRLLTLLPMQIGDISLLITRSIQESLRRLDGQEAVAQPRQTLQQWLISLLMSIGIPAINLRPLSALITTLTAHMPAINPGQMMRNILDFLSTGLGISLLALSFFQLAGAESNTSPLLVEGKDLVAEAGSWENDLIWMETPEILADNLEILLGRESVAEQLEESSQLKNRWFWLMSGSGLIGLLLLMSAAMIRLRKYHPKETPPESAKDVEMGLMSETVLPGNKTDGEDAERYWPPLVWTEPAHETAAEQQTLMASAQTEENETNGELLLPSVGETSTTPGKLRRTAGWIKNNPWESATWALTSGMLTSTIFSGWKWSHWKEEEARLWKEVNLDDILLSITPDIANFLQQNTDEEAQEDNVFHPLNNKEINELIRIHITRSKRSLDSDALPDAGITQLPESSASKEAESQVSHQLTHLITTLWSEEDAYQPAKPVIYLADQGLYQDARMLLLLKINQHYWEVDKSTYGEGKIILLNEKKQQDIDIFRDKEGQWKTAKIIFDKPEAITSMFRWENYSPRLRPFLKYTLKYLVDNKKTINLHEIRNQINQILSGLFFKNYHNIEYGLEILQAQFELNIAGMLTETTHISPEHNKNLLASYQQAMSFLLSDDQLFAEALQSEINGGVNEFSEEEKRKINKISLLTKKHNEVKNNPEKEYDKVIKKIKEEIDVLIDDQGLSSSALDKKREELRITNVLKGQALKKVDELREKIVKLQKELDDHNERKILFSSYQRGITSVTKLINQQVPGLLNDSADEFDPIAINHLRFSIAAKELALYQQERTTEYSADEIALLHELEAQKNYLLTMTNLQWEFNDLLKRPFFITSRVWYNDYRDIIFAGKEAQKIMNLMVHGINEEEEDTLRKLNLLTAAIYRKNKENATLNTIKDYSVLKTLQIFEQDKIKLNPLKIKQKEPEDFISFRNFKKNTEFNKQYDYNEQFNRYKIKYSHYEAENSIRLLLLSLSESDQVLLIDLMEPPKKIWYFLVENKPGNLILIETNSEEWLVLSTVDGNLILQKYRKDELMMPVLTDPEHTFGYDYQKTTASMGMPPGIVQPRHPELSKRVYPYALNADRNEKPSDNSDYELFWQILYDSRQQIKGDVPKLSLVPTRPFKSTSVAFWKITGKLNLLDTLTLVLKSSLDGIADYSKEALQTHSNWHEAARIFIPFYDVIYKSVTDSAYTPSPEDVFSIVTDVASILATLAGAGIKLTNLSHDMVRKLTITAAKYHFQGGNIRRVVYKFLSEHVDNFGRAGGKLFATTLVDLLEPVPLGMMYGGIRKGVQGLMDGRTQGGLIKIIVPGQRGYGKLKSQWKVNVDLSGQRAGMDADRFAGVYSLLPENPQTQLQRLYYIQEGGLTYQVRWDNYNQSWRAINPAHPGQFSYAALVKRDTQGHWVTHMDIPGVGGVKRKSRLQDPVMSSQEQQELMDILQNDLLDPPAQRLRMEEPQPGPSRMEEPQPGPSDRIQPPVSGNIPDYLTLNPKTHMLEKRNVKTVWRIAKANYRQNILDNGFLPSDDFQGINNMLGKDAALIVSETEQGARYFGDGTYERGFYDVYKIDVEGLIMASLKDNVEYNVKNTANLLEISEETLNRYKTENPKNIAEGALDYAEAHVEVAACQPARLKLIEEGIPRPDSPGESDAGSM